MNVKIKNYLALFLLFLTPYLYAQERSIVSLKDDWKFFEERAEKRKEELRRFEFWKCDDDFLE